jgi:DNA (cytosine-5)-methyltransferase 1
VAVADCSPPITGNQYGDHESREGLLVVHTLRGEGFDASEDGTGRGTPLVVCYENHGQDSRVKDCGDPSPTIHAKAGTGGNNLPLVAFQPRIARNGRGNMGETVNALQAQSGRTGKGDAAPCVAYGISNQPTPKYGKNVSPSLDAKTTGGGRMECVSYGIAVRRLTPRECERLQGFPDDWTATDADGKTISDSARYRMLGNAVAVPVARWIGKRILKLHTEEQ